MLGDITEDQILDVHQLQACWPMLDYSKQHAGEAAFNFVLKAKPLFEKVEILNQQIVTYLQGLGPMQKELLRRSIDKIWKEQNGFEELKILIKLEKKRRAELDEKCKMQNEALRIVKTGKFLFSNVKRVDYEYTLGNSIGDSSHQFVSMLERRYYQLPENDEIVQICIGFEDLNSRSSVKYERQIWDLGELPGLEVDFTKGQEISSADIVSCVRDCSKFLEADLVTLVELECQRS